MQRPQASEALTEEEVAQAKAEYNKRSMQRDKEVQEFLENGAFAGKVGAFEGAGYASTGLYRSSVNCIMFTRTDYFCQVCQQSIIDMIKLYSNN